MNYKHTLLFITNAFLLSISLTTSPMNTKRAALQQKLKAKQTDKLAATEGLIIACRKNNPVLAQAWIKDGANVNHQSNIDGTLYTPLHIACINNNPDLSKLLLDHGADASCLTTVKKDNEIHMQPSPWLIACENGFADICDHMITKDHNVIFSSTPAGYVGLHLSAQNKHIDITQKIIAADRKKILINKQTTIRQETPLHLSVFNKDMETTKILVESGANVDCRLKNGTTPLFYAVKNNLYQIAEYLLKNRANPNISFEAGISHLHIACLENLADMAKLLIAHKANPNTQTKNGISPLFGALIKKDIPIFKILLDAGANVNVASAKGITLLNHAEEMNHPEIIKLLEEKGLRLISQKEAAIKSNSFFETLNQETPCSENKEEIQHALLETKDASSKPEIVVPHTSDNQIIDNDNKENTPIIINVPAKVATIQRVEKKPTKSQAQPSNSKQKATKIAQKPSESPKRIKYTVLQSKNFNWPRSLSSQQEQNFMNRLKDLQDITSPDLSSDIKPLKGELAGKFRMRVGGHRVLFSVDHQKQEVIIHGIQLRKNVYK